MRQILNDKKSLIQERKLLILIATDGVPTDNKGQPCIQEFHHILKNERQPIDRVAVTIIACTGKYQSLIYPFNFFILNYLR